MADEKTNQPSRADFYRKRSEAWVKEETISKGGSDSAALWAIAAELAEANSRDREAEIRAKSAEAFVAGIQAELARQHIVVPGGMKVPK